MMSKVLDCCRDGCGMQVMCGRNAVENEVCGRHRGEEPMHEVKTRGAAWKRSGDAIVKMGRLFGSGK
jgi:hypothetical protein